MTRTIPIDSRRAPVAERPNAETVERPTRYRLASGRVIPLRVLDMVLDAATDIWADGGGGRIIERLRLRFVGLTREELTELVFGDVIATRRENAALRSHIAGAVQVAHEARNSVWWPDIREVA